MTGSNQVTRLLTKWGDGDSSAQNELMPIVYDELRRMARRYLRGERQGHSFQTTELIHEAYLKLAAEDEKNWKSRNHFYGVAACAMRNILVDYARAKKSQKRGGGAIKVDLEKTDMPAAVRSDEIINLDEALKELARLDTRKSQVVELKFFGGLKTDEIAAYLDVSPVTVKRDWTFARSWLLNKLASP